MSQNNWKDCIMLKNVDGTRKNIYLQSLNIQYEIIVTFQKIFIEHHVL